MGGRLTRLLLLIVLGLAAVILVEWRFGTVDRTPIAPRASGEAAPQPSAAEPARTVPPLSALTETTDRPLFSATRRPEPIAATPVVEGVPAPAVVQQPPPALVLSAVVLDATHRLALFQRAGGLGSLRVSEGELVEGWTLAEVRPDGVTLEKSGVRHEIVLRTFKPAPALAAPGPRAAPVTGGAERGERPAAAAPPAQRPRRPLRGPRQRARQRAAPTG